MSSEAERKKEMQMNKGVRLAQMRKYTGTFEVVSGSFLAR